jgi:hypothetical protein
MEAAEIAGKHVWLMESIVGGEHVTHARPRRQEDLRSDIELLVNSGYKRIWVTPKIPFIVPMLASLVLTTVIGNLLFLMFPI